MKFLISIEKESRRSLIRCRKIRLIFKFKNNKKKKKKMKVKIITFYQVFFLDFSSRLIMITLP